MKHLVAAAFDRIREHGLRWAAQFYLYRTFRKNEKILLGLFKIGFFKETMQLPQGLQPINIKTYFGITQTVHPSIIKYKENWILALTPYPFSDCYHENPCIYASNNGLDFNPILSAFPIDRRAGAFQNYLSDPNLSISISNELIIRYRETLNSPKSTPNTFIWESRTSDLKNWTPPRQILNDVTASVISPASRRFKGVVWLYFVSLQNDVGAVYRSLGDRLDPQSADSVSILGIPYNCHPWHLDFIEHDGHHLMLLTTAQDGAGSGTRLFLCKQVDFDGLNYSLLDEIYPDLPRRSSPIYIYKAAAISQDTGHIGIYLSLIHPNKKSITYYHSLPFRYNKEES